ncbi:putative transcriptional regulator [Bradyrhizobium ottawaense]|uniref:ASCH domain-containing protein n=1 Tax=Bradyrhizobium ottawaense TaxID=931866 RepID=UPI0038324AB6
MLVLLSIKPTHVANILAGTKTFEFRRRIFARKDVKQVLIYCTKPVGRFVGEFEIADILCDRPDRLWKQTRIGSGISKEFFDDYFEGRDEGYALKIGRVRAFSRQVVPTEVIKGFSPPQSFMYVDGRWRVT